MNEVMKWAKANMFIVVFIVIGIVGPALIYWQAGKMNASVTEKAEGFQSKFNELDRLKKTQFVNPVSQESRQVVLNRPLLENYKEVVGMQQADMAAVLDAAVGHNQKNFQPLVPSGWRDAQGPWLFPAPPEFEKELRPAQFHQLLMEAYDRMIRNLNAGSPPSGASLEQDLISTKGQFKAQKLAKRESDPLTPEEELLLRERLGERRIQLCAEAAKDISFYLNKEDLFLPGFDNQNQPDMATMWEWQWQYWIHRELLEAVGQANADADSVLRAPVQRVLYVSVVPQRLEKPDAGNNSGGGSRKGSSGSSGGGTVGGAIDPQKPIKPAYESGLTGLYTNALYDVRDVQMGLVVDTDRVPDVLNALARQNFISIVDMNLRPLDPFIDAEAGFFYAPDGLVTLELSLQTVWFRQWTSEFMPDSVKAALGVPVKKANTGN